MTKISAGDRPAVSVIIPAYNAANFLAEAIDCLLRQTLPPAEIVVVDDGSTDNTPEILRRYGDAVIAIRQDNAGESAARNRALEHATGRYVALLDADDVCAPERLERQATALRENLDAVACFTGNWKFNEQQRIGDRPASSPPPDTDSLDFLSRCLFHIPTVMFDRVRASGLRFPRGVKAAPDIVFAAMLRTRGGVIVLPEPLYGYRSHAGQISIGLRANSSSNRFFEDRYHWARSHWREYWPELTWQDVERRLWQGLAKQTEENYWARHKDFFLNDQRYMRKNWPAGVPPPDVLRWRWYPDWLWYAKSRLDQMAAPVRRQPSVD